MEVQREAGFDAHTLPIIKYVALPVSGTTYREEGVRVAFKRGSATGLGIKRE
jgi:hypothetical protein